MRVENGPSLPLACDLCRVSELQTIRSLLGLYVLILLRLFRPIWSVDLGSSCFGKRF